MSRRCRNQRVRPATPALLVAFGLIFSVAGLIAQATSSDLFSTVPVVATALDSAVASNQGSDRAAAPEPLRRNTVEVYFPSVLGNGLVAEYTEIFETVTPGDRAKQIVADLISGPTNPDALRAVPSGTRLRQAYVLEDGTCYLDFSRDLVEGIGGGSMEELLTIYAIVDSVVVNVPEIKRVGILIEGDPIDSLNGHLDLRRPLPADSALILPPVVVDPAANGQPARVGFAGRPGQ